MFAGASRDELRKVYLLAWRKFRAGEPLEPLERQLAVLISDHPEYIPWLEGGERALAAEFAPESGLLNPFLHLGLHMALREQVATDRPAGIRGIHQSLSARLSDAHQAEHRMLEVLGETLWAAQRNNAAPDEAAYLERLRRL